MADLPTVLPPGLIEALVDPMQRLGFDRDGPRLTVVGAGEAGGIAASWVRGRDAAAEDPRRTGDGEAIKRHGNADGVAVWREGHVGIGVAGTSTRVEWRRTMLGADELALTIEAFIESLDRFAPPR